MNNIDVLIVGAGPTGLVLALWLTRQGVSVRIIDKSQGPGETSRAMAVQARTLELYRQLDMAEETIAAGYKMPAMNMWARGEPKARIPLENAGNDISPYPFVLILPQDRHEKLLVTRLQTAGVVVERQTEFMSFREEGEQIVATITTPTGQTETCTATYLAGCDGAHSPVRHQIGSDFEGGTYDHLFYVADVLASGVKPANEGHIAFDKSDFVLVMPYGPEHQYRLIGTVESEDGDKQQHCFDDVSQRAINGLGLSIKQVNWFSTYRVHHRVTNHFRHGRAFLLGDAAHVHSPAGGQGMNTGIADAINLAWKLAAVIKAQASEILLDSYEAERKAFAHKLVKTTDRVFTFITAAGGFADFVRTHIAPSIASQAYRYERVREYLFRVISQTTMSYPDSPLSEGKAGEISAGDRLPYIAMGETDNYASLRKIVWQIHIYGTAAEDVRNWCDRHGVEWQVFPWQDTFEKKGFKQDTAYLIRPDGYIGLVVTERHAERLSAYVSRLGIQRALLLRH
ncbi:FAD-dependent oxidoreductase [Erwinia sp. S63]|uniref:FAD-dependent oxidoreductase n=1 Tax=Erwinia sp. S63 TaxID=2769341 RepID=UPI00190A6322|nr:FAD-dependent oxidoreductase [Erwinia sp. S63]MBK0097601.1 FAD-dependent oxidoreductase [Erwinia sp. S63]